MFDWLKDRFSKSLDINWVEEQNKQGECTPDWFRFNECRQVLYFAYGEDMPGKMLFNKLMTKAIRYGRTYTAEPLCMFERKDPKFAVALETELRYTYPPCPLSSIRGELLGILPENLRTLDTFYDQGTAFLRKRIWLYNAGYDDRGIEYGTRPIERYSRIASYIHVGNPDYWTDRINNYDFQPVERQDNLFMKNFYVYGDKP